MKKFHHIVRAFVISLALSVTALLSCKKNKPSVQIHVTDSITHEAVAGADVVVYKCGTFNCYFGTIDLFSGVTDNSGNCKTPEDSYNEATFVRVAKGNYWSWDDAKSTSKSMVPAGWMRVRLVKSTSYSPSARLDISVTSQSTNSTGSRFSFTNSYGAPADSSILIKGFGGESNAILWEVYEQGTRVQYGNAQQQVPRLDTVKNIVLNY